MIQPKWDNLPYWQGPLIPGIRIPKRCAKWSRCLFQPADLKTLW